MKIHKSKIKENIDEKDMWNIWYSKDYEMLTGTVLIIVSDIEKDKIISMLLNILWNDCKRL